MQDYKPLVVSAVERSIDAVNAIVATLQRDQSLRSDILDLNYPKDVVEDFNQSSELVVENLRLASSITARWLQETGDRLSSNLSEAGRIQDSIRGYLSSQRTTEAHIKSTQARIYTLESDISSGEGNLASAQRSLSNAREELDRQETMRGVMRVGAIAAFFFAPIFSIALTVIDMTALENAVEESENTISTIEQQLSASRSQLQSQRNEVSRERAESCRLSSRLSDLQRKSNQLSAESRRLTATRGNLAELSVRINDCLHTVNSALSSSTVIASMSSMRNVVSGIRGVVGALGADAMFTGPLARLDDAALASLDRRVAAIRRHRLTV
ncbi:hypothetical protein C8Q74DRAFT_1365197 [Fomes fomentarius]|nr:hypothetical protein C8Q74DRAFT_1365197 [Fomes fomentarius]